MSRLPYVEGALVSGEPARVLAQVLRRAWGRGDFDGLPADKRAAVLERILAIDHAAEVWWRRQPGAPVSARVAVSVSDSGSSGGVGGADGSRSDGAWMSAGEAAVMLGVSERRARQLGPLLGRKVGGSWLFDRVVVAAELERRAVS